MATKQGRKFQSTCPMRGATVGDQVRPQSELISIHAPLAGCDIDDLIPYANNAKFQSSAPSRGVRPRARSGSRTAGGNISIHAPHAGRDSASMTHFFASPIISIHAPRRGARQRRHYVLACRQPLISIHAPRAGRDRSVMAGMVASRRYFNPRAPCGARLCLTVLGISYRDISIHAPRAGRDGGRVRGAMVQAR